MYASKNNATWVSTVFEQEPQDNDWAAYQVKISGEPRKFYINESETSASQLSLDNGHMIQSGQELILSTDGQNFVRAPAGAITTTAGQSVAPTADTSKSESPSRFNIGKTGGGVGFFIHPDGSRIWRTTSDNVLQEWVLSEPFNPNTAQLSGKQIAGFGNVGFCFSPDGRRVFSATTAGGNLPIRFLSTRWDISTAGPVQLSNASLLGGNLSNGIRCMRFSPDGLFFSVMDNNSTGTANNLLRTYSLTRPFDISSGTILGTSNTFGANTGGCSGFEFAPDGKTLLVVRQGVNTAPRFNYFTCNTPFDPSPSSIATIASVFGTGGFLLDVQNNGLLLHPNGRLAIVLGGIVNTGNSAHNTYTLDFNTKHNIDISAFNLSSAPTSAYYAPPRVFVDMEQNAKSVNMARTEQDFISATTSQVVLGAKGAGVLVEGDKLLLNNTTEVTTTGVTQGSVGGLPAQFMGRADKYVFAAADQPTLGLPWTPVHIRFRNDGSSLYAVQFNGSQILQYNLEVPWDISTAYVSEAMVITTASINSVITVGAVRGIDFKPDGTMAYLNIQNSNSSNLSICAEFSLAVPWSIASARFTGRSFNTTNNIARVAGGRFNEAGTQYYYSRTQSSSTNGIIHYHTLSSPFDLSTAAAAVGTIGSLLSESRGSCAPQLLPGGAGVVVGGPAGTGEQILTASGSFLNGFTNPLVSVESGNADSNRVQFPGVAINRGMLTMDFSPDGMRAFSCFDVSGQLNVIRAFRVRTKPLTQYTATFEAQGTAPTSVAFPDRSVEQVITPAITNGQVSFSTDQVLKSGRGVAMKVQSPYEGTEVTNLTLDLWKQ